MLTFANKYGHNVHSQNGEDGIIAEVCKRLQLTTGHCVEIGGNDGLWLSNTRALLEAGWSGKFIEASWPLHLESERNWAHRADVKSICSKVDGHNVNAFVNDDCDLLSADTDGVDYEILKGLKAKPAVVIIEIDSSLPPTISAFNSDGGASYAAMVELAVSKGYTLLCHTGNLILVDDRYAALVPEVKSAHPMIDVDKYFNRGWLPA